MNLRTWSAIGAILLLASCSQGTGGIFASIEREQKVKSTGGLSQVATVTSMAEMNSRYYIAGGAALFQRSTAETDWHSSRISCQGITYSQVMSVGVVTIPGPPTTTYLLYAVANRGDTGSNQLFSSTDGSTWSIVSLPTGINAYGLLPIKEATKEASGGISSDELLLTTYVNTGSATDGDAYEQVFIVGSSGISVAISLPNITFSSGGSSVTSNAYSFPITGAATDGSGYYFVNNDGVFYSTGSTMSQIGNVSGNPLNGNGFADILLLPTGTLSSLADAGNTQAVISNNKGALYWGYVSNTGAWTAVGSQTGVNDLAGQTVTFGPMIYNPSQSLVWIGTLNGITNPGAGIASLSASLGFNLQPPAGTDSNNYSSSLQLSNGLIIDLEIAQVPLLYVAGDGSIFAGTAAEGLWRWTAVDKQWNQQ